MTLRHRITFLVVLAFVAISAIGAYALFQARGSASEVKTVTEGVMPSALASADLVSTLKEVQLATMYLVSSPDEALAEQARERLAAKKSLLQKSLEQQAREAGNDAQRGLVEQAGESLANYFAAIDDTLKYQAAGKHELAQANLFGNVVQYQAELEVIVETLRVEKNRDKDSAIAVLNRNLATTTTTITIVTVLAVLLMGAIGALLYRRITRPISRMQAMMSEIAASQDFTRRVPVHGSDEIGRSIVAFNDMIRKIEESSALLKRRTADIQAMLQHMPQGVLTVVDGVRIHPEYSAYLETILETDDIVGRDLIELVFADTNLGADAIAQIDAACRASIGEDVMNFEFNEHLLASEIEKTMPDGRVKILDLSWSPITDDAGNTARLMLCVRDVTELRKLAAEASEQKRKLEIIGEILAVDHEKFNEFIAGATRLVNENETVLREHAGRDAAAIAQLFRNMHTIKGNARTYGLHHLTNIVHEAEQSYDELREPDSDLAWDRAALLGELAGVREALELYAHINEVSLGRKKAGRRGGAEHYLMVDRKHIQESLHRLETVNPGNLHDLVAACYAVRKTLHLLGTETMSDMLSGVLESLPSLAEELDKAAPIVRIEDKGYRIRSQAGGVLKNVFMHLLRNALDHGLETPEVRALQGKPPAGTIALRLGVAEGMLRIELSDDGRGLALARIRRLAAERGLIEADQVLTDEETAALVFRAGFSTADRLTGVSGRGVGMDAVRDFLKREQGKIEIRFTDALEGADYRQFKTLVYLPDSLAVSSLGVHLHEGPAKIMAADIVHGDRGEEDANAGSARTVQE